MATPKNNSVLKAFAVLNSFHQPDEWVTSCELSRRASLPQASCYRLIRTLQHIGAVVRGPHGRYRPGMLLVALSHNVAVGEVLRQASHDIITELAYRLNVTIHLGILEAGMVTYIAKVSTPTSLALHTRLGAKLEAYCSGLGKILLAALSADELEEVIHDGDLVALTPYTITDRSRLREELAKVKRLGYAVDDREIRIDMRCLAVPIHDAEGRTIAAMSVTDYAERMSTSLLPDLRDALLKTAVAIEKKVFPQCRSLEFELQRRTFTSMQSVVCRELT